MRSDPTDIRTNLITPLRPHVIRLFGATGDLARPGPWGPNAMHQLIAPDAWRLPFERGWRSS